MSNPKVTRVTIELSNGAEAIMDFEPDTTTPGGGTTYNGSGTSYQGYVPEGVTVVENAVTDAVTNANLWPNGDEGKDFIVTYLATVRVRMENMLDEQMALNIAGQWLDEQKIADRLETAIDDSDFYIDVIKEPEAEQD